MPGKKENDKNILEIAVNLQLDAARVDTVWLRLPKGSVNPIRAEIMQAKAAIMRVSGTVPMTAPEIRQILEESIVAIGAILGRTVTHAEAEKKLTQYSHYFQINDTVKGMKKVVKQAQAEDAVRRILYLVADDFSAAIRADKNRTVKTRVEAEDTTYALADTWDVITEMNRFDFEQNPIDVAAYEKLRDRAEQMLSDISAENRERKALESAYDIFVKRRSGKA